MISEIDEKNVQSNLFNTEKNKLSAQLAEMTIEKNKANMDIFKVS